MDIKKRGLKECSKCGVVYGSHLARCPDCGAGALGKVFGY